MTSDDTHQSCLRPTALASSLARKSRFGTLAPLLLTLVTAACSGSAREVQAPPAGADDKNDTESPPVPGSETPPVGAPSEPVTGAPANPFVVRQLVTHVDTRLGVTGAGSNIIGPTLPHGSIHPSPHTANGDTSGYDPTSTTIRGFGQLHVSGTGGNSRYGNILLSPQTQNLAIGEAEHDYVKSSELTSACQYSVTLASQGGAIRTELTPTHNAAIYRFTYPENESAYLALDLAHNIPGDILGSTFAQPLTGSTVSVDAANRRITGTAKYRGGWWDSPYTVHFAAVVSKPPAQAGTWKDGTVSSGSTESSTAADAERIGAYFRFATTAGEEVYLKIAVSLQSVANAEAMLAEQIPALDDAQFSSVKDACESAWNRALSSILIDDETATGDQLKLFYSNLYHALLMPRDRTGDNPWGATTSYFDDHYTDWDAFRTTFPLLTLIRESTMRGILNSYLTRFARDGVVHDAYSAGANAWIQGGDVVDVVIGDAYVKGVSGVNWNDAYAVMKHNADAMRSLGYRTSDRGWSHNGDDFPAPSPGGSAASKTLEFALSDFAVAQVAKGLGHATDEARYMARSTKWRALWDTGSSDLGFTGFIRPKTSAGVWEDIHLRETYHGWGAGNFYEGSSWTYSFFVPHDVKGLMASMGGATTFVERLDAGFSNTHGCCALFRVDNEPAFLIPWMYVYGLRPDKTSARVRTTMEQWTLTGYPGDEDAGAMGAWYVFAAMGFFPNAGQDLYLVHGPKFRKLTVQRENGANIVIEGPEASSNADLYIGSATLNGAPLARAWLTHSELAKGALLSFTMSDAPSDWGTTEAPPAP